jgi:aminoglycoside phosphotransferase family enzyme
VQTLRHEFRTLRKRRYRLADKALQRLHQRLLRQWRRLSPLLLVRAQDGCLIEGHGDLRAEHVYLLSAVLMIDRLVLSQRLRTLDPWDEAGFLALDCQRLGRPKVARQLLAAYDAQRVPKLHPSLVHFYQAMRACTRARLAIVHLDEARYRGQRKWRSQARLWLNLAQQCAADDRHTLAGRGRPDFDAMADAPGRRTWRRDRHAGRRH